jgi:hypothetical protein
MGATSLTGMSSLPADSGAIVNYASSDMISISIEADIQSAWSRANSLLSRVDHDPQQVAEAISDLRMCIERVKAAGLSGERELWWLIKRLAGLNSGLHEPTYLDV